MTLKQLIAEAAKSATSKMPSHGDFDLENGFEQGALWAFRLVLERYHKACLQNPVPVHEMTEAHSQLDAWATEILGEGE